VISLRRSKSNIQKGFSEIFDEKTSNSTNLKLFMFEVVDNKTTLDLSAIFIFIFSATMFLTSVFSTTKNSS
jgi:hypothetical protein